jgi:lipopolysaccharide export system protein LptA
LGTPEFGHRTERKRKRLARLVIGSLAAAVLVIAAYRLNSPREKKQAAPQALPSNVNQRQSGFSFTRSENGRQEFTVHASRTTAFKGGRETVLRDVWVEVFGRSGNRRDVIRTRACDYNRETGALYAGGKVEIELNAPAGAQPSKSPSVFEDFSFSAPGQARSRSGGRQPIFLETSQLSFVQQGALVVSDAPVRFRAGAVSGTALGLEYATRDNWVEFKKNVAIEMEPRAMDTSPGPLRLEAGRLRFDKTRGTVSLGGPVVITQQGRRVTAEDGTVLLDALNRVTAAELDGEVKAHGFSGKHELSGAAQHVHAEFDPQSAQLRSIRAEQDFQAESKRADRILRMAADVCQVNFSGQPSRPVDGNAEGNVRVTSETVPGAGAPSRSSAASAASLRSARQDLTARRLNFSFRPDGQTLQSASTAGPGTIVVIPRDPKVGQRRITADNFEMEFDVQGRPATLRGMGQAHVFFLASPLAAPGTPEARTSSDRLLAFFDPSGRTLRTVDQTGDFRFEQGDQQAFADRASYDARSEVVTMTGHPRAQDEETRLRADRILIHTNDSTAEGEGHVQAVHLEKAGKPSAGAKIEPTFVVADRMVAERQSQFVHYQGHVRLWRGTDVIESPSLDVFKAERRVRTGSHVVTTFLQSSAGTPGATAASHSAKDREAPVTIRADGLEYSEEGRKASYRGNVELETQNATLHSDRLDVFFSPSDAAGQSGVERAVAEGHVVVVQPGRRATGERAEYFAGPGKILVTGGPPALYDAEKGFTTGRRLTFFLRDDTIFLDGGKESPTLSKHQIPQ